MKIAYVAGPYRAETTEGTLQNIMRARACAVDLWSRGYGVICPHANSALMSGVCPEENFLKAGLEMVKRSDMLVLLAEFIQSHGAMKELQKAVYCKLPIYIWYQSTQKLYPQSIMQIRNVWVPFNTNTSQSIDRLRELYTPFVEDFLEKEKKS